MIMSNIGYRILRWKNWKTHFDHLLHIFEIDSSSDINVSCIKDRYCNDKHSDNGVTKYFEEMKWNSSNQHNYMNYAKKISMDRIVRIHEVEAESTIKFALTCITICFIFLALTLSFNLGNIAYHIYNEPFTWNTEDYMIISELHRVGTSIEWEDDR